MACAGKIVQTPADKLKPSQRKLLETLASEQFREAGATFTELCTAAEVSKQTANRELSQLVELGYIQHGQKGDPYIVTTIGQEALSK